MRRARYIASVTFRLLCLRLCYIPRKIGREWPVAWLTTLTMHLKISIRKVSYVIEKLIGVNWGYRHILLPKNIEFDLFCENLSHSTQGCQIGFKL